jgi:hypothetical protein
MTRILLFLSGAVFSVAIVGCGTPQAVLDQARNTGALTAALQSEIEEYRRTQATIAEQRIKSVQVQLAMVARNETRATYADRLDDAIGNTEPQRLYKQLLDLADNRAETQKALEAKLAGINDQLSKVLAPLPETTAKLGTAQKAMIPLSEELSPSERIGELAAFAKAVKDGIDESRKKIKDAEKATPNAPVQNPD